MSQRPHSIHIRLRTPGWATFPPRQSPTPGKPWHLETLIQMAAAHAPPRHLELFLHPARCLQCLLRWTPLPTAATPAPMILPFSPADFLAVYHEVTVNHATASICGESLTTLWLSPSPACLLSDTPGVPSHHLAYGAATTHA